MSMSTRPSYFSLSVLYIFSTNHFMSIYSSTFMYCEKAPLDIANCICNVFLSPSSARAGCCALRG